MPGKLEGRKIAFLVAPEGTEQIELTQPWEAVRAAGGAPILVSTQDGSIQAFNHLDRADAFPVDATTDDISVSDYDALVLPGGVANPDYLRMQEKAVAFAGDFFAADKPVAVICHGPWTLIEADVLAGRTLTSWPSLKTDIVNAGGNWTDKEVVVCTDGPNPLVSSRNPDDLPAFCATLVETFAKDAAK